MLNQKDMEAQADAGLSETEATETGSRLPDQEHRTAEHGGATAVAGRRRRRPPKLYRIGEVVGYSGVSRQTIHNYTTMGLLQESSWTPGGHRLYDDSVFDRLDEIIDLKAENKSLQEIREHFERRDRC